mmetsp:Transcript_19228/g.27810  ORF Transcript_19228/g.27810 Transcript_19228/m.27810 type:complete len:845 (+) Transcript_19228:42-2576(+)
MHSKVVTTGCLIAAAVILANEMTNVLGIEDPRDEAGYYDKLRREKRQTVRRVGNVDAVEDDFGRTLGLCHLVNLNAFTDSEGAIRPVEYDHSASALLAMHHFNTGDGSIVPAFDGINQRCDVRFTTEVIDTGSSEFTSLRRLADVVARKDSKEAAVIRPCAILGNSLSASSILTAPLSSVQGLPQLSWFSSSSDLNDRRVNSHFARVILSTDVVSQLGVRYLVDVVGYTHCAVIYLNDNFGNSHLRSFVDAAVQSNLTVESVPFPPRPSQEDLRIAIEAIAATQIRCVFAIVTVADHEKILEEAFRQNIVGPDYFWLMSNNRLWVSGDTYERGSALDLAVQGVGQFHHPVLDNEDILREIWDGLDDDTLDYFTSILPETDEFSINQTKVRPFAYDTIATIGLAACNITNGADFFDGDELAEKIIGNTSFRGSSGPVVINPATGTRFVNSVTFGIEFVTRNEELSSEDTSVLEAVLSTVFKPNEDGTGSQTIIKEPFVYFDGTNNPPPSLPLINDGNGPDFNFIGNLRFMGYTLFGISAVSSIGFAAWTIKLRNERVVKASQPEFLIMICVGTLILSSAIIPLSVDDEFCNGSGCDAACMSAPWLMSIGFVTAFSALFSKTWRINKILRQPGNFRRVKVTWKDVMAPFMVLLTANVIILICFTTINPLKFDRDIDVTIDAFGRKTSSVGSCRSDSRGGGALLYAMLLLAVNLSCVILANVQAYLVRGISTEFQESSYIAIGMAGMLQMWIVGVPLLFLVRDSPQAYFAVWSLVLFVPSISLNLLMFVPKIKFQKANEARKEKNRLEKMQGSNDKTGQVSLQQTPTSNLRLEKVQKYQQEKLTLGG